MNTQLLVSIAFAVAVVLAMAGMVLLVRSLEARRARRRLQETSEDSTTDTPVTPGILRDEKLSSAPLFDALLQRLRFVGWVRLLLVQGDLAIRVGPFLGIVAIAALAAALVAVEISGWAWSALPAAALAGSVPILVAVSRKRRRLAKFEKQFPDALDLLTGALRSGLAFSTAIQVVSEESPEPVSTEFTMVYEENRLGLDLRQALRNLAARVDSSELRMFVTAVIIQRESGGNLAEVLERTAQIIRERMQILGEVRALTAQQRFSGTLLGLLPVAVAGLITIMAPEYMRGLLKDPMGPPLIAGAVVLQILGFLIIRMIVRIKV